MSTIQNAIVLAILLFTMGCTTTSCNKDASDDSIWKAKTLLSWQHQTAEDKKKDSKEESADGKSDAKENGNGSTAEEEESEIATDRPDFTEASSTVGKGRIQLETGYTYSRNRQQDIRNQHSYPEALLRIGMFADWFELRLGQNYSRTQLTTSSTNGFEDFYLGTKLALTEQKEFLPESALILQTTLPTGPADLTANKTLPGINYLFGWDIIPDLVTAGGSVQANAAVTDSGASYLEVAQSFTVGYSFTKKLASYVEVFGIEPHGAREAGVGPEYYFNGGFTYKFTSNFQYDIRAGVGLNKFSDDFFVGTGCAFRY
jgi:hypothetical protein